MINMKVIQLWCESLHYVWPLGIFLAGSLSFQSIEVLGLIDTLYSRKSKVVSQIDVVDLDVGYLIVGVLASTRCLVVICFVLFMVG